MLGMREYTLCSPFRANAHNSSFCLLPGEHDHQHNDWGRGCCCLVNLSLSVNTLHFIGSLYMLATIVLFLYTVSGG